MKDAFNNKLNIKDHVALMVDNYSNHFDRFVSGIIIGFTDCFVQIRLDDKFLKSDIGLISTKWNLKTNSYENVVRKIILRKPHRIIKIN